MSKKQQKDATPEDMLFKRSPDKIKRLQRQAKREQRQADREQYKRERLQ